MKPVKFLGAARADLHAEKSYYQKINPVLAAQFVTAVEAAVKAIAIRPLAMQIIESNIRRWPVMGFPHGVLYRNEEREILILAVFHPKQEPGKWQRRV